MLKKEDNVFVSGDQDYCYLAFDIIQSYGLIPFVYANAGLSIRNSSLDREIRDDFYQCKATILILHGKGETLGDNWALPELKHSTLADLPCFIYVLEDIDERQIKGLDLPIDPVVVKDKNHFKLLLKKDLQRLMNTKNI